LGEPGPRLGRLVVNFRDALQDLDSRQPESMPGPSLERIERIVQLLDDPQLSYPSIHITGTNGKTTTARLVTRLACAHGLPIGTFISPHLESVTERLSVCGDEITEEEFAQEYTRLAPYLEAVDGFGQPVTYFEVLTALAYLWFADKPVSLGAFEVGMGGTWDATNLIRGDVAVICPIGLDHVQILGRTVPEIAREKAGIIKEGRTAVVRSQPEEALAMIRHRVEEIGAILLLEDEDFGLEGRTQAVGGQSITVQGQHAAYQDLFLPLFGEPAARNAAAAVVAMEALLSRALDGKAVRAALLAASSSGRMEVAARHPTVILDGAHNPEAMVAVAATLRESFRWSRLHTVVAMFEDKDVEQTLAYLGPVADFGYAATTGSGRAAPVARVAVALREAGVEPVEEHPTVAEALAAARAAATQDDLILVTGSFYTVGEARPAFA